MRLNDVKPGEKCVIKSVKTHNTFGKRLCDLGFVEGTGVTVLAVAPLGDPIGFDLRGYRITLRKNEAALVEVVPDERERIWKR